MELETVINSASVTIMKFIPDRIISLMKNMKPTSIDPTVLLDGNDTTCVNLTTVNPELNMIQTQTPQAPGTICNVTVKGHVDLCNTNVRFGIYIRINITDSQEKLKICTTPSRLSENSLCLINTRCPVLIQPQILKLVFFPKHFNLIQYWTICEVTVSY